MTNRMGRAARILVLGCLAPTSGCCTVKLWDAAPKVRPERLVGARVDVRGELELGVEMTDGERRSYRQDGADFNGSGTLPMTPAPERDAGDYPWPCTPDANGAIALHEPLLFAPKTPDPELQLTPGSIAMIEVFSSNGNQFDGWVRLPDTGALRWEHPGTWTCVVATPVSAAVDLVTLPIQFVVLLVKWPRC